MKIIDINGKERNVKDAPKIVTHVRKNVTTVNHHENIEGELVTVGEDHEVEVEEKYAEVIIVGNRSEWTEWYPLELFEKMNPWFKQEA